MLTSLKAITYTGILSLALLSCDAAFQGDGQFGSKNGRFSGGQQGAVPADGADSTNPNGTDGNPYGPGVDGDGNGIGTNTGIGDGSGGSINTGTGIDTADYQPATLTVLRRDLSHNNDDDHRDVQIGYKVVGSARTEIGAIPPGMTQTMQIPRACPENGTVEVDISFITNDGRTHNANKNTSVGGPIGHRMAENRILVGFEKDAVNNSGQRAYHNNDDLVVEIYCPGVKRLSAPNLCFDTRILTYPTKECSRQSGQLICHVSDLVNDKHTYSGDDLGRMCNGS